MSVLTTFVLYCGLTILVYQVCAYIQRKTNLLWLNPMLLTMLIIIPLLILNQISFNEYYSQAKVFSYLLEPAIVALGFPLYQQLHVIKAQFKLITLTLLLSTSVMMVINLLLAMWLINQPSIAVSLALKSITTPIGLILTEQFDGVAALTAVGIIVAGLVGGVFGTKILEAFGVTCKKSQGLAIGCASHALGTASVSSMSFEHGAFASLALIMSALITALITPLLIPLVLGGFGF